MSDLLRPGLLRHGIEHVTRTGLARNREALAALALVVERRAKKEAGAGGAHAPHTPTPATPGRGPAVVSGDLRRSITHTEPAPRGIGWTCRVGPASTPHRVYGGKRRASRARGTTSGVIGKALETGLRGGHKYPFLKPAADEAGAAVVTTWAGVFRRSGWKVTGV